MLTDAIVAEASRLWHNRSARFWGFAFVPLALLIFNLALDTYLRARIGTGIGLDLGQQILRGLESTGSAFIQIFYALGAGAIFAGDYRWETWRLIAPRNTRANLLLAKFAVYGIGCALSLVALGLMGLTHALYGSLLNDTAVILPSPNIVFQLLGVFASSWLELLLLGAVTALFAVTSRAMIGAAMATIMLGFFQAAVLTQMSIAGASPTKLALLPRLAAETLGAFADGREIAPSLFVDPYSAAIAAVSLTCWIVLVGGLALILFQRQELSRE